MLNEAITVVKEWQRLICSVSLTNILFSFLLREQFQASINLKSQTTMVMENFITVSAYCDKFSVNMKNRDQYFVCHVVNADPYRALIIT